MKHAKCLQLSVVHICQTTLEEQVHSFVKSLHIQVAKLNKDHVLFSVGHMVRILGPLWIHLNAPLVVTVSGVFLILH